MKRKHTKTKIIPYCPAYPNAKDARYYIDKTVDILLAIITALGAVTAMFFMFIL